MTKKSDQSSKLWLRNKAMTWTSKSCSLSWVPRGKKVTHIRFSMEAKQRRAVLFGKQMLRSCRFGIRVTSCSTCWLKRTVFPLIDIKLTPDSMNRDQLNKKKISSMRDLCIKWDIFRGTIRMDLIVHPFDVITNLLVWVRVTSIGVTVND